ncbi:MAG: SpoIIE family protein phosphatase [bacterium]|nr:SpoIIE family protein phosphatase [bacterium]
MQFMMMMLLMLMITVAAVFGFDYILHGHVMTPNEPIALLLFIVVAAFAIAGMMGLTRLLHSTSDLTLFVINLTQKQYAAHSSRKISMLLQPLDAALRQLARIMESEEKERRVMMDNSMAETARLREELNHRNHQLEDENRRLSAISRELGEAYSRLNKELNQLADIQKSLLPPRRAEHGPALLRALYLPNGRTGGDYYDFIAAPNGDLFIAIADVSGHGSPAAFIMGVTRALLHSEIEHHRSPSEILASLNRILMNSIRANEFVTMFLGRLLPGSLTFTFSNAGHLPPVLLPNQSGSLVTLEESRGVPLGVLNHPDYTETSIELSPGDRVALFTDGVVEAFNKERRPYGEERLYGVLTENRQRSIEDLIDAVAHDVEMFTSRPLDVEPMDDDMTLAVFEIEDGRTNDEFDENSEG